MGADERPENGSCSKDLASGTGMARRRSTLRWGALVWRTTEYCTRQRLRAGLCDAQGSLVLGTQLGLRGI